MLWFCLFVLFFVVVVLFFIFDNVVVEEFGLVCGWMMIEFFEGWEKVDGCFSIIEFEVKVFFIDGEMGDGWFIFMVVGGGIDVNIDCWKG